MRRELEEIIALIESRCQARPTPMEFEMAYQARVAMDRIRFAIKHAEQFAPHTDKMAKPACNCSMRLSGWKQSSGGSSDGRR